MVRDRDRDRDWRGWLEYRALAAPLLVRIKLVDVDLHNQLKRNGNSIGSNIASGYLTMNEVDPLLKLLDEISRMLAALIRRFDPHGNPRRKDVDGQSPPPPPRPKPIPPPSS